jgi:tocopherol O-methyltransferase
MNRPPAAGVAQVREHYDSLSTLYDIWWGEHLHHGYWDGDEDEGRAQVKLVEKLAAAAGIPRGCEVLDVGCGLGGSSLWLAAHLGCRVRGITISPVQARLAESRALDAGLGHKLGFEVMDAHDLKFRPESFDVLWSVECTEHLRDKQAFFRQAAEVLRVGGRLAVCAWLAADDPDAGQAALLRRICRGMICPSLGSMNDHLRWIRGAGFEGIAASDLTAHVKRTWDRCEAIARRPELKLFLKFANQSVRDFANAFPLMREAYATGAMRYGMFTAGRRPE